MQRERSASRIEILQGTRTTTLLEHIAPSDVQLSSHQKENKQGEAHPTLLCLDDVERDDSANEEKGFRQSVLLGRDTHLRQRIGKVRGGLLAIDKFNKCHPRWLNAVPHLTNRFHCEIVLVRVARVQEIQSKVVAASNDAELVALPIVVRNLQAVCRAWPFVVHSEGDVHQLANGEVSRRVHLLVQQQRCTLLSFIALLLRGRECKQKKRAAAGGDAHSERA
mmetsp:Transcript_4245/g.9195  ORF Transcript_4245/g.9195 Transcript_4245/m.9195 type:complete len:222 (+) Transcript_4245:298-963(+)|eukprot:CAMPEP_0183354154 /NCGR_PEP_ID=MMETSP0164_2-20130417/36974_1 /TAXON_ID=221442 /ORGANISM="Coccolithus pelagicus ssp braarudi, Strain PLY182g" /LENGTH=221 /DNA_ID=CAMNT_0025526989 /DNA_START=261 /DNA_END=926 /DNA_ORIENTATION=-